MHATASPASLRFKNFKIERLGKCKRVSLPRGTGCQEFGGTLKWIWHLWRQHTPTFIPSDFNLHVINLFRLYRDEISSLFQIEAIVNLIPWHHSMVGPQPVDGDSFQTWSIAANMLNKQSWTSTWMDMVLSELNGCFGGAKWMFLTSKNAYRVLVAKLLGIQPFGRMRTRWKCPVVHFGSNSIKHTVSPSWELE